MVTGSKYDFLVIVSHCVAKFSIELSVTPLKNDWFPRVISSLSDDFHVYTRVNVIYPMGSKVES